MAQYLLDTNVCIHLLKQHAQVIENLRQVGPNNCFISEITVAELLFGAEKSNYPQRELAVVAQFTAASQVLTISPCLRLYAKLKSDLQRQGLPLDDFDLLIGATAVVNSLRLVTNNTRHFVRLPGLELLDWTKPTQ